MAFKRGIKQTCKTVWEKLEEPDVDTEELEELFAVDVNQGVSRMHRVWFTYVVCNGCIKENNTKHL